ncbi:glycine zipper 2TM domain-containing protein [Dyella sp. BiH032]|uniref:glycine zipper 2TM domain-containing protein n=1 Tax=Dyella sp. BiH032 TaxID=3075430 RepID=UPI002892FEF3|nr:glycine zipper 2TM domain-containing protein [Dyella sp. BiH032]WNL47958.1 glycine zipper 2TM domain-containing protein [Dyella sp. BiH032]
MNAKSLLVLPLAAALTLATASASAQTSAPRRTATVSDAGTLNGNVLVRRDGIFLRCSQCGTVESIERNVTQGADHGTAGAIIGAVAGGVLGNQVGKGNGRKLATVAGAVGGGFAGNRIGRGGTNESWVLRLRMGDGSYSNVTVPDASAIREGDLVQVDPDGNVVRIQ